MRCSRPPTGGSAQAAGTAGVISLLRRVIAAVCSGGYSADRTRRGWKPPLRLLQKVHHIDDAEAHRDPLIAATSTTSRVSVSSLTSCGGSSLGDPLGTSGLQDRS